jgi:hypothetical protein
VTARTVLDPELTLAGHARAALPIIYASGNSVDRSRSVAGSLFFDKSYRVADVVAACHSLT